MLLQFTFENFVKDLAYLAEFEISAGLYLWRSAFKHIFLNTPPQVMTDTIFDLFPPLFR